MSRTARVALVAAALAAECPAAAYPHHNPPCRLEWSPRVPTVTDNGDGTYTVDLGPRPQWVC
jgi:hypothetical protein